MPIMVVGAGWAGLSTAFSLAQQGKKVILLEAAPQAGGRARGISFGEEIVDNGQHLLIGAYTHTLKLLQDLGLSEADLLERRALEWCILDLHQPKNPFVLKLPTSSNPFSVLFPIQTFIGFLKTQGLSISERLKIIQFYRALEAIDFQLSEDISVQQFLEKLKQPTILIHKLWGPMALAALSTPIHQASAQVFLQILKDSFSNKTHPSNRSNGLFPKVHLSALLPDPILKYLKTQGNSVFFNKRVQNLILENGRCTGVRTATQEFKGSAVVLATPPRITAALLRSEPYTASDCQALIRNLEKFQDQPITTVYLKYPHPLQLKTSMIGLVNAKAHWIFDRRFAGQANILSLVITGSGAHLALRHADLVQTLHTELQAIFPNFQKTAPLDYRVICEKRAAFSCEVGIAGYRPNQSTPYPNLYLAGDYTQNHYPATLESAVRSGVKAAQLVLFKHVLKPLS